MEWIQLVSILALIQLFYFSFQVGRARSRYGIKPPATSGNVEFERYFRAHMNTLEIIVQFLPSLWIAAIYWGPRYVAMIGAVYLIGRIIFFRGYVIAAEKRHVGFLMSVIPIWVLMILSLIGIVRLIIA